MLGFSTTPYAPKSGTAEGSQYLSDGAEQLDIETKTDLAKLEAYFKEQRGENPQGSHRKGLDYVPYDDYLTYLHKGERVLTNQQAQDYRNGQNNQTYSPTMNIGSINMNRDVDVSAFFAQYDDYVTRKRRGYGWG
ncbi:MAG: hypothetical protein MJZ55_03215 [Paludibacteraceae bacterium]|nr:hypothetical protein [Paludibacteraceae bacterium]